MMCVPLKLHHLTHGTAQVLHLLLTFKQNGYHDVTSKNFFTTPRAHTLQPPPPPPPLPPSHIRSPAAHTVACKLTSTLNPPRPATMPRARARASAAPKQKQLLLHHLSIQQKLPKHGFLAGNGRAGQPNSEAIRSALLSDIRHKPPCSRFALRWPPFAPLFSYALCRQRAVIARH